MPASPKFYFGVDGHSARSMELRNCSTLCGILPRWLGNCDADWMQTEAQNRLGKLGGVDKFKPVSGSGEMDHAEEAVASWSYRVAIARLILSCPNIRSMRLRCL